MEYVEGKLWSSGKLLPPAQALTYGAQIADALDKAHRHGIIHCDLKPGNRSCWIFGLAKLREEPSPVAAALTEMTVEGERLTQKACW